MKSNAYLLLEFFLLFILLPLSLPLSYPFWLKSFLVLASFVYVLVIVRKSEHIHFRIKAGIPWKSFLKRVAFTFLIVIVATTAFVLITNASALFYVPFHKPGLFAVILLVYTLLSVWPQEIIYRTFFFERYERLFPNKNFLVFINAVVFMMAHLFFRNTLVLIITFIGGIIFGLTYLKFESTTLVSIEHALYGNWLFTVGMGQMLDFPGYDN